jgi:monoamine oxidase
MDMTKLPPGRKTFLIGGRRLAEEDLNPAFAPLARRIAEDYTEGSSRFNGVSLTDYVTRLEVKEPLRTALLTDYTVENGLDPTQQSALNLIYAVGPSPESGFTGNTDHRYKVRGGNQLICQKLADRLELRTGHELTAIRPAGEGYRVHFANGTSAEADFLVLALPFTLLRRVELPPLPETTARAIRELSYGTNSKLVLGFTSRFWNESGDSGSFLCDRDLQDGWDSSRLQDGSAGSLTLYFGGSQGLANGDGTPESRAAAALGRLDEIFPGASSHSTGKVARLHWPTYPWSLGSYSAYRVGEYARPRARSLDRLLLAGEHMSHEWQGFMNGAAETGRQAAESILQSVRQ